MPNLGITELILLLGLMALLNLVPLVVLSMDVLRRDPSQFVRIGQSQGLWLGLPWFAVLVGPVGVLAVLLAYYLWTRPQLERSRVEALQAGPDDEWP